MRHIKDRSQNISTLDKLVGQPNANLVSIILFGWSKIEKLC